jgi:hypothetical protein
MRIILTIFPDRFEAYSSLKPFYKAHPEYMPHRESITNALSRRKEPYKGDGIKIYRLDVIK